MKLYVNMINKELFINKKYIQYSIFISIVCNITTFQLTSNITYISFF